MSSDRDTESDADEHDTLVSIGRVVRPHGRRGELSCVISPDQWSSLPRHESIICGAAVPSGVRSKSDSDAELPLAEVRGRPDRAILRITDVESIDQAVEYRGKTIYLTRAAIRLTALAEASADDGDAEVRGPENEVSRQTTPAHMDVLRADLIGLAARTRSGEDLGTVFDVLTYPAQSVLAISAAKTPSTNKCLLIPFVAEAIVSSDLEARTITVIEELIVDNG